MRLHCLIAVGCLVLGPSPTWAFDYSKINRTLAKEPTYQSETPAYALLLFGRDAFVRVWVVLDGETVYLDRNADGDLTAANEQFESLKHCKGIQIADPESRTTYVITMIRAYHDHDKAPPRTSLMVFVHIKGPVSYWQYGEVRVDPDPGKAAIAHFHGPLTAGPITINWEVPPDLALVKGEEPTDLRSLVGTISAEHGCWVVIRSHRLHNVAEPAFPERVHPVVEIEFPPKHAGDPPIKKKYALDEFC